MRRFALLCSLPGFVIALLPRAAVAQGTTAFTYQGQLDLAGSPAAGTYQMVFRLYDGPSGGPVHSGPLTNSVAVSNGLFTTQLDFGATFSIAPLWLEIGVRTNGSATAHVLLAPRHRLTPVPYAVYAARAGDLQSGANATFSGTVTFNPVSGPPFNVGNNAKVPNLNADLLDGIDSSAFVLKGGDTMTGNLTLANPASLNFGNSTRQMLNLWGSVYGLGVQAGTLYFRTDGNFVDSGNFAWYRGGTHADGQFDPGDDGAALMTLDRGGRLGTYGASTTATLNDALVVGLNVFPFGLNVVANAANSTGVYASSDHATGIALRGHSLGGYAGQFDGAVRINFDSPFDKPQLEINQPNSVGFARLRMRTGIRAPWDIAVGSTPFLLQTNSLRFFSDGNGDVMSLSTNGNLFVRVLTITGGADISEPFKMSQQDLPKGAVVVIDEENPGHLKLSQQPYDTRVAGIISGAGGVNPGLSLSQQGVMEGDQPVALSGRVYVQADASHGPIRPGDLLTTSPRPGYAMKVTDHLRAQGAIIGKAMTGLKEGKGLALVLVSLQ
jgi:hypothetical protein